MKYFLSPELHRNLWLKFSPFKFVAAPFFFFMLAAIIVNASTGRNEAFFDLTKACLFLFGIFSFVWGSYEAGTALQEEIKGKTWDLQRLSALSPLKLAFGKLFGATSYTWYAALWPLAIIAYAFALTEFRQPLAGSMDMAIVHPSAEVTFFVIAYLLLAALFGQGIAFLAGFSDAISSERREGKSRFAQGILPLVIGVTASMLIYTLSIQDVIARPYNELFQRHGTVRWYYQEFSGTAFLTWSLLFFLGWIYMGIYRIAQAELMYPVRPAVWVLFVLGISAYAAGFQAVNHEQYHLLTFYVLSSWCLLLSYASMLNEASDIQKIRRMASNLNKRDFRRIWENMPRWMSSFPFAILFLIVAIAVQFHATGFTARMEKNVAMSLSLLLFAIRDGIFVHMIALAKNRKHIKFMQIFYFLMAYILLPALHLSMLGNKDVVSRIPNMASIYDDSEATGKATDSILSIYYPATNGNIPDATLPVLLQVGLAAALLLWVIRRRFG